MKKTKDFKIPITNDDILDVRIISDKNTVIGFVINYRARLENAWYQIYRVDTCHEYLHEQRFWLSPEPIALPRLDPTPLKSIFNFYLDEIKKNYERYKGYYINRMRLGK